jgi:hypothetical protein
VLSRGRLPVRSAAFGPIMSSERVMAFFQDGLNCCGGRRPVPDQEAHDAAELLSHRVVPAKPEASPSLEGAPALAVADHGSHSGSPFSHTIQRPVPTVAPTTLQVVEGTKWLAHDRIARKSSNCDPASSKYNGLTVCEGTGGWVVYNVEARSDGPVKLSVQYNTNEHRPLQLDLNDRRVAENIADIISGHWTDHCRCRWDFYGPFTLKKGTNSLKLHTDGFFPHLAAFRVDP